MSGAAQSRKDRTKHQAETFDAPAYAKPWTPAQDRYLMDGPGTLAERAIQLGRTYYAASFRRQQLLGHQGVKRPRKLSA